MTESGAKWSIHSDMDARWNVGGSCNTPELCPSQIDAAYEKLNEMFGAPPQDIEIAQSFRGVPKHTHFIQIAGQQVTARKKIGSMGDSLAVAMTKELKRLGLSKGDYVQVTLSKSEEKKDTEEEEVFE